MTRAAKAISAILGSHDHNAKYQQYYPVAFKYPLKYPAEDNIADLKLMNEHFTRESGLE